MNVFFAGRRGGLSRLRGLWRAGESGEQADNQPRLAGLGNEARSMSAESKLRVHCHQAKHTYTSDWPLLQEQPV